MLKKIYLSILLCFWLGFLIVSAQESTLSNPPDALPDLATVTVDNGSQLTELFTLQCEPTLGIDSFYDDIRDVTFSPVDNRLAVVSHYVVCIFDLDNPSVSPKKLELPLTYSVFFSVDGQSLYTMHNGNDNLRKWDTNTGEELRTALNMYYTLGSNAFEISPDQSKVAIGCCRGLGIWNLEQETLIINTRIYNSGSTVVTWHPSGDRLATWGSRGVGIYTLYPNQTLYQDTVLATHPIKQGLGFGGLLDNWLVYNTKQSLVIFDIKSNKIVKVLDIFGDEVKFSPFDNYLLLVADQNTAYLWDTEANTKLWEYSYELESEYSDLRGKIDVNLKGTLIVSNTDNELVHVWGILNG